MATNNAINNISKPITDTYAIIDPGASGDSFTQFNINSVAKWRMGVDDDDSDKFKISKGSALGTNDYWVMTSNNQRTLPSQPAFATTPNGDKLAVTGDGTTYTVVFDLEDYDQSGDFDGSTTFTAPVAGVYYFYTTIYFEDLTTSYTSALVEFNHNSGSTAYEVCYIDPQSGFSIGADDAWITKGHLIIKMSAADTMEVELTVSGSSKNVDIGTESRFGGYLLG